jgi:hypothetical protein
MLVHRVGNSKGQPEPPWLASNVPGLLFRKRDHCLPVILLRDAAIIEDTFMHVDKFLDMLLGLDQPAEAADRGVLAQVDVPPEDSAGYVNSLPCPLQVHQVEGRVERDEFVVRHIPVIVIHGDALPLLQL